METFVLPIELAGYLQMANLLMKTNLELQVEDLTNKIDEASYEDEVEELVNQLELAKEMLALSGVATKELDEAIAATEESPLSNKQ